MKKRPLVTLSKLGKRKMPCLVRSGIALLFFWTVASYAQSSASGNAASQSTPPSGTDKDVVVLSPFEVTQTQDTSYYVEDTLAGNRLRSSVKDVGAALTIIPKNFMNDLGVSDIMDVADYVPGVERLDNQEDGVDDNTGTYREQRFRIRGLYTEAQGRNYFTSTLAQLPPADSYNLDRVTFAKGANSILFGAGNPAGIINQSTIPAILNQRLGSLQVRTDNYGTGRFVLTANEPLIKDRLAFRLAYLKEDGKGWRDPEWSRKNRVYGALKLKLGPKTTLSGNLEYWDVSRNVPYWGLYHNMYGAWQNAGMPLVPYTGAAPSGAGIRNYAGAALENVIYGSTGQTQVITTWRNHPIGAFNRVTSLNLNQESVPWSFAEDRNLAGDLRVDERWGTIGDVTLEHRFTDNLSTQLAFFGQKQRQDLWISWTANQVNVDAASTLPDGSPNPDAGRYFINAGVMQLRDFTMKDYAFRWTTSYDLDLQKYSKYLGRHQFALMFEDRKGTVQTDIGQLFNIDPNRPAANYMSVLNKPQPIVYVNPNGSAVAGGPPPDTRQMAAYLSQFNNMTAQWENIRAGTWTESMQKSYLAVMQSHFFNDRIVTTLGYRIDHQDMDVVDPADWQKDSRGFFVSYRDQKIGPKRADSVSGIQKGTYSLGGVFNLIQNRGNIDFLALGYNQSTNFEPSSGAPNYQGGLRGSSTGFTHDYSVRVGLFGGQLHATLDIYDSGQKKARLSGIGYVTNQFNAIYDGLAQVTGDPSWQNRDLDNQTQNGDTFDNNAKGASLTVTYSPTSNWRIYLSADRTQTRMSNIAPSSTLYIKDNVGPLRSSVGNIVLPDGQTVNEVLDSIELQNSRTLGQAGTQPYGQGEYKFSFVTNYSFHSGALKGFDVGGNLLWRDKPVIGWARDTHNDIIPSQPFYGRDFLTTGLSVGYRKEIMHGKYTLSVQLNVRNLLDDRKLLPLRAEPTAVGSDIPMVYSWNYREPRSFILTTSLKY